jgi:hypothetical protein
MEINKNKLEQDIIELKNKLKEIEDEGNKDGYDHKMNCLLKNENNSLKQALDAKSSLIKTLYNKLRQKHDK